MAELPKVLAVDLDGSLLASDMLLESFWSAFGQNWRVPFGVARALTGGRAALKRYLAQLAPIDPAVLPYRAEVLAYIAQWRSQGGRVVLVTASDQRFADQIAQHLGLFDAAYGSDGQINLKGQTKAQMLTDRYGPAGFAYLGDSMADLAVWRCAGKAVVVNASAALRRRLAPLCADVDHVQTAQNGRMASYFWALRPHQWLKNALVFLPMLAAHQINAAAFGPSLLAFICFSLSASGVYVVNDLLDLAADRAHPRKRHRPFAAGQVALAHGSAMAIVLLGLGLGLAGLIGAEFLALMVGYLAMTTAYSLYLKRQMVIDICVLAGLYTLRIIAGGSASDIVLSVWLLAFSMFFFLSLAAVKRQTEMIDSAARGQLMAVGRGYHVEDVPIISMVAIGAGYLSVLVMALYVNSPTVAQLYGFPQALWGVSAVLLYWITRTVLIAHRGGMHDDPVVFAAKDGVSRICLLIILGFVFVGAWL